MRQLRLMLTIYEKQKHLLSSFKSIPDVSREIPLIPASPLIIHLLSQLYPMSYASFTPIEASSSRVPMGPPASRCLLDTLEARELAWLKSSMTSDRNNETTITYWLVVEPPLWKIWKSVGMMTFPIYGKRWFMFQTTNHDLVLKHDSDHDLVSTHGGT